jgi:hypothetical protein
LLAAFFDEQIVAPGRIAIKILADFLESFPIMSTAFFNHQGGRVTQTGDTNKKNRNLFP